MTFLGFFFLTSWSLVPPWHLFSHDSLVCERHLLYRHSKPLQKMLKIRFLTRLGITITSFIYHWQPSVMWGRWNKKGFYGKVLLWVLFQLSNLVVWRSSITHPVQATASAAHRLEYILFLVWFFNILLHPPLVFFHHCVTDGRRSFSLFGEWLLHRCHSRKQKRDNGD